eukprot:6928113-Alexandrium_andersonii.AAC.1
MLGARPDARRTADRGGLQRRRALSGLWSARSAPCNETCPSLEAASRGPHVGASAKHTAEPDSERSVQAA